MNQNQVVVSFKQDAAQEVQIRLHVNGQQVFETNRPDVFAGALRAVGAEKLQFRFYPDAIQKVVDADYPLTLASAFGLVEHTDGFETTALMKLIQSSIQLHDPVSMEALGAAVSAWALAEVDLPAGLVVNRVVDLPKAGQNAR